MRRAAFALLSALALAGCTQLKPLRPLVRAHSDEVAPPLKIEVRFAASTVDLTPVKGWYENEPIPAHLYAVAKVTNISNRVVVLVAFSRGPSSQFEATCASPDARRPNFFISYNGQVEWIFLKPGESAYSVNNLADSIAFLREGHFDVEYQYQVGYAYAANVSSKFPPWSKWRSFTARITSPWLTARSMLLFRRTTFTPMLG